MKNLLLVQVLLLCLGVKAQQPPATMQIQVQSAVHAQGGKLTLYEEWPIKRKVDTLVSTSGTWNIAVQDKASAVYRVQLSKPYINATLYFSEGKKKIVVGADTVVHAEKNKEEQQLEAFERSMEPFLKRAREIGTAYTSEKNMEAKLLIGEKNRLLYDSITQCNISFIRKNAGNINGIWVAEKNMFAWDATNINILLEIFKQQPAAMPLVDELLTKQQQFNAKRMTGNAMPSCTLTGTDGKTINVDSLVKSHRYVLIDFWASWCAPCRATNRKLAPLYNDLRAKGVEVVSISVDENKEAWIAAIDADKIPWLQLRDADGIKGNTAKDFKVSSLPTTFLVDQQGIIRKQNLTHEELKTLASSLP